jgi:long-subunit fatty acid transport protein
VDVTTTRNDGIDPNTGEPYEAARIDATIPVFVVGATWRPQIGGERLVVGLAAADFYVGGGDYLGEDNSGGPYTGHQRYSGIQTRLSSVSLGAAASYAIWDRVFLGAGMARASDSISLLQASDPFGKEGVVGEASYAADVLLEGEAKGSHWTWNAGIFTNRNAKAQGGLSYTSPGTWQVEGQGTLEFPEVLGDTTVPTNLSLEMPLPAVWRGSFASQVSPAVRLSLGVEYQAWGRCCSDASGDTTVILTSTDGDAIDEQDGVITEITPEKHVPRRLEDSISASIAARYQVRDTLHMVIGGAYDGNAVPDYAVSPTNLDFTSLGGHLGMGVQVTETVNVGASYARFFPFSRTITDSAWGVRDTDDPDYVDDRFSSVGPFRASSNGSYAAQQQAFGLRLSMAL